MKRGLLFALPVLLFAVLAGFFVWGLQGGRDPRFVPSAMIDEPIREVGQHTVTAALHPEVSFPITLDVVDG